MIKTKFLVLASLFYIFSFSQDIKKEEENSLFNIKSGTENDSVKYYNPTIQSYKYWTEDKAKAVFDTVLTLDKYYKNKMYNHEDSFGLMPFSNIGQAFNPLLYTTNISSSIDLLPQGKSFNLMDEKNIRYFDVQTPMTEFQYNNGYKQGHSLSSLFTHNINSQFNYSIQYKGLRSSGKYMEQLAENNTLLITSNYHTKNQRYNYWTHYLVTHVNNEENGGIKYPNNFEDGDSRFKNRNNMEVNLTGAKSEYEKRRFYFGQQLGIFKSLNNKYPISVKNIFSAESAHYKYEEKEFLNQYFDTSENMFGSTLDSHNNTKKLRKISNTSSAVVDWTEKLHVEAGLKYEHLEFSFDRMIDPSITFPRTIIDNRLGIAGKLSFNWKEDVKLNTEAEALTGDKFGNSYFLNNYLTLQPLKNYFLEVNLGIKSQIPSLNQLYNQSFYKKFNYFNDNFENERTVQVGGKIHLKPFNSRISAQFYNIDNYVYVDSDYKPQQLSSSVNLVQLGLQNSFEYKKFHLETSLMYQKVTSNDEYLPLPEFVGRATLYYQSQILKKNSEIQLGLNAYYFTKFKSREFFPVTNEFKLQSENGRKIGEYPILDIFLHFKVKRMLIILEGQHFNSSFTGYDFYSTPGNPYIDFRLNVGILWYIFT